MDSGFSAAAPTVCSSSHSTSPSSARRGRHSVQFYYDDGFLTETLSNFVRHALEVGQVIVLVATPEHRLGCAESLREKGVNLALAIESGRYLAFDASETLNRLMSSNMPVASRFEQSIGDMISEAAINSRPVGLHVPVAIFGEMVALLMNCGEFQAAVRLEQLWNDLSKRLSFDLLCGYRISSFDQATHRELFHRICSEHDVVIPAEGYAEQGNGIDPLRTIALLQQTEQVLKTERVERQLAQAQNREAEYQKQQLRKEIRKHEAVEEELRKFTRRLLAARDEEQRRIAAELHENMAQLVSALSLYFGVIHQEKESLNPRLKRAVASSRSVSDSLLREIRKLSRLLHPLTLDEMGLAVALKEYVDHVNRQGGRVQLEVSSELGRFNRELEITVFRIIEEALDNFNPRSGDTISTVRLTSSNSSLLIEIESAKKDNTNSEGSYRPDTRFTGIHERVMEHNGSVHFTSTPSGTLISISLPLDTRSHSTALHSVSPLLQKIAS
jgi:signal transduction histidine kinase